MNSIILATLLIYLQSFAEGKINNELWKDYYNHTLNMGCKIPQKRALPVAQFKANFEPKISDLEMEKVSQIVACLEHWFIIFILCSCFHNLLLYQDVKTPDAVKESIMYVALQRRQTLHFPFSLSNPWSSLRWKWKIMSHVNVNDPRTTLNNAVRCFNWLFVNLFIHLLNKNMLSNKHFLFLHLTLL